MTENSKKNVKTITVFGSALPSEGSAAYVGAQRLGRLLAEAGYAGIARFRQQPAQALRPNVGRAAF